MSSYKIHDFESHVTNGVTINNSLNITGTSTLNTLNVSEDSSLNGALDVAGNLALGISGGTGMRIVQSGGVNYIQSGIVGEQLSAKDLFIGDMLSSTSASNRKIMIKADGDVGIGTSQPSYKLHVVGDINFTGTLYQNGTAFESGSGGAFETSGSNAYYNSGNVGIGTTNPSWHLHVADSGDVRELIQSTTANQSSLDLQNSNKYYRIINNPNGTFDIYDQSNGQSRFSINTNGNVGIGTATPSTTLHISSGNSGNCVLRLEADTDNDNETDVPIIEYATDGGILVSGIGHHRNGTSNNALTLSNSVSDGGIVFETGTTFGYTNATERMKITTDGNVGIGTSSPEDDLHISSTSPTLLLKGTQSSDYPYINLARTGATSYQITDDNGSFKINQYQDGVGTMSRRYQMGSDHRFYTGTGDGDEILRINTGGVLIYSNGGSLDFVGEDHIYMQFYPDGTGAGRKGYMGYTSAGSNSFTFNNSAGDGFDFNNSLLRIKNNGNVGIGTNNPSHNLEVNGTFEVTGNGGFSGMMVAFNCESNGSMTEGEKFSFGDGSTSHQGARMPKSGSVKATTVWSNGAGAYSLRLYKNGSLVHTGNMGTWSSPPMGSGWTTTNGSTFTMNVTFSAGDRLWLQVGSVTNNGQTDCFPPSDAVATFYVKYD